MMTGVQSGEVRQKLAVRHVRQNHLTSQNSSTASLHLRALRGGIGNRDLSDPFHVHPIRRAVVLMILCLLPVTALWTTPGHEAAIFEMVALVPPLFLWPFCLAVIGLCASEEAMRRVRRRWRPSIELLEIAPRLRRVLHRHGFDTIASVEAASDTMLLLIPNLDERGIQEIRRAIHLRRYQEWQDSGFASSLRNW